MICFIKILFNVRIQAQGKMRQLCLKQPFRYIYICFSQIIPFTYRLEPFSYYLQLKTLLRVFAEILQIVVVTTFKYKYKIYTHQLFKYVFITNLFKIDK